ncbi:hypothetical protein DFH06DRAFT_559536 [Mycena polygramma]|nr:hypothetical protein DFH06DRAFT_559536 [Mycena polygramma]
MNNNIRDAVRTHLADLEAQRTLAPLRAERAILQERLNGYKYPVLTVPYEIVAEIFVRCLPVYPLCPPLIGLLSPTNLTQICRQWREVAVSIPQLWRAIQLSDHPIPLDRQHHILASWLGRSGCWPLSICVRGKPDAAGTPDSDGIISALSAHRGRWDHIDFDFFSPPIINGPTPLLRQLTLKCIDRQAFTLPDAPLLRTVTFIQYLPRSNFPWAQLTSLTLCCVYFDDCVPFLRQTSNLVHCDLEIWPPRHNSHFPATVALPRLESLVLKFACGEGPPTYLDAFMVPDLQSLQVSARMLGWNHIDSVKHFVFGSGCRLQELLVTHWEADEAMFRAAFPSIPQISFDRSQWTASEY